ncbi:MAG: VOC family protein [Acidimicrobiia bacterium]|nr:VOC family protein [Acidimicrobiia bacterium]
MASASALDHIVLAVADVDAALDWYMRHAGLSSVNVDEWRAGNAFFPSLRVNEATIIDFVEGEPGSDRGHLDHICFVVTHDDLAALASDDDLEIVDQGERSGARGMGQSVYVRDPDRLLVEFRSYPAG